MKIQPGEYVRLKNGKIIKFVKFGELHISKRTKGAYINEKGHLVEKTIATGDNRHFKYDNIVKHSFNLIELLEAGDYVNGKEIILKDENENCVIYGFKYKDEQMIWHIYEEDIKTIVTKEQFESVEYKVKENNNG